MFKAIGRGFKAIGRAIKKAAPFIVLGAAVFFTAGAALGFAPAAGGWGAAVSKFMAKLPFSGVLKGVLHGALKGAGYGAMAGAVTGDVGRGAKWGAITGGALGGLNAARLPAPSTTTPSTTGAQQGGTTTVQQGAPLPADTLPPPAPTLLSKVGDGLKGVGGYLKKHPELLATTVQGIGSGLTRGMDIREERRIRDERRRTYEEIDYEALTAQLYAPGRYDAPEPSPESPSPQEAAPVGMSSSQESPAPPPRTLLQRSADEILEGLRVKKPMVPGIA